MKDNTNEMFSHEISNKLKSETHLPDWIKEYPELSDQICLLRKELGLSQEKLGQLIGSSGRLIRSIENKEFSPNLSTLKKIASALKANLHLLLIPQKKLEELIEELAEKRAKEITDMAQKNSAIEKQAATQEAYRRLLEKTRIKL
jgi:transcriptional regulator with XRE-family HTH domain